LNSDLNYLTDAAAGAFAPGTAAGAAAFFIWQPTTAINETNNNATINDFILFTPFP